MAYTQAVDIENKALQHLGATLLVTATDNSKNAINIGFAYDKCILAEQRSHVWQFGIAYATLAAASPATQTFQNGAVRNRFTLPANYLRLAQQDPHSAGVTNQGTSAGTRWGDYSVEGPILLTAKPSVLLRYVAFVGTVTLLDPLFCEALAARIAFDTCEIITQNLQKRTLMAQIYNERIIQAARINLIETATDEPMEDQLNLIRVNAGAPQPAPQPQRQR